MNRREIEEWVGNPVFLICWPFTSTVNTAEGKQYWWRQPLREQRKQWTLLKLTKGGMALITDGENTFGVPPFYVSPIVTIKEV
jgi:hypothetical protein